MTPDQILAAIVIGGVVGVLPGLFGVGGGFLLIPLLHVFAGVPIHTAVGSCASQSLGSVTTGMLHRRAAGRLPWKLSLVMLPATFLGLELGIQVLEWTKESTLRAHFGGRELPLAEFVQLAAFLVIMVGLAAVTAVETYSARDADEGSRRGWFDAWSLPPYVTLPELDGRRASLPVMSVLGVAVGFLNGGFGMGGAILLVPGLVYLIGLPTHRAVAVTLVSSWLAGFFSVTRHALRDNVDLGLVCWLLLGGTLGARLGSTIADRLSGRRLRRYFSWVILGSTGVILWRLATLLVRS